ncbi:MAG: hypothetical protein L6R48_11980 [Planctomycetes bacterium]|nr:hypothetical protein [Planctomycetota bacterium]
MQSGQRSVVNSRVGTLTADGRARGRSKVGLRSGFTGFVADSETGLCHARARQYSPTLGRFVGRDPWVGSMAGGGQGPLSTYADGFSAYMSYFIPGRLDPTGMNCLITFNCVVTASTWKTCSYNCTQVGKGVLTPGGTINCDDVPQPASYSTTTTQLCGCANYTDTKIYSDLGLDCSKAACKAACKNTFTAQKKACALTSVTGPGGVAACIAVAQMSYIGCDAACGLCTKP